ncbi:hypothetical protein ABC347_10915 [Sphingomonas sp. 1P06PA]|uniref:hypothetical protein n=1 Tax=Sphingomonas sp. 1P06PA TaxID=554121 RepID=UPI0039A61B07
MRKITLYGPAVDRLGRFRDAGEELTVGGEDNTDTDLTIARADELIEQGVAVTMTEAREDAAAPDPLDHDGNGRKGGVAKPKAAAQA